MTHPCFICQSVLPTPVLDLGEMYPSAFLADDEYPVVSRAPLRLCQCEHCGLVQLDHAIALDTAYRHYWYQSGINGSMTAALRDVVRAVESRVCLSQGDVVVDIGCNDGTLLDQYTVAGLYKVGYDPALNLKTQAERHCNTFVNDYFSAWSEHPARAITAIAMFYDLPDPGCFLDAVVASLHADGIFVVQLSDLLSMIRSNAFDAICHEHLEYYSLNVLYALLRQHGLDVFDLEHNDVNGGSLRLYCCHLRTPRPVSWRVPEALREEEDLLKLNCNRLPQFDRRIHDIRNAILIYLHEHIARGSAICGLGASTKGNTLLQWFGLDQNVVSMIGDISPSKVGLRTVGTDILIGTEAEVLAQRPDVLLILPWHFRSGFEQKLKPLIDDGCEVLFPLPEPEVVSRRESRRLPLPSVFHEAAILD